MIITAAERKYAHEKITLCKMLFLCLSCKEMHFESTGCERGSYATVGILYVEELGPRFQQKSSVVSCSFKESHLHFP